MGVSDVVRLKKNGTFKRTVELLDDSGSLYEKEFRIQTALWTDPATGKNHYVSIFPNFIKRYIRPGLNVLEYISCQTGKGEDIFRHIDDRNSLYSCEDRIATNLQRLDKICRDKQFDSILNARYTLAYNRPISIPREDVLGLRFPHVVTLILVARQYFGLESGVLAAVNALFRF